MSDKTEQMIYVIGVAIFFTTCFYFIKGEPEMLLPKFMRKNKKKK